MRARGHLTQLHSAQSETWSRVLGLHIVGSGTYSIELPTCNCIVYCGTLSTPTQQMHGSTLPSKLGAVAPRASSPLGRNVYDYLQLLLAQLVRTWPGLDLLDAGKLRGFIKHVVHKNFCNGLCPVWATFKAIAAQYTDPTIKAICS